MTKGVSNLWRYWQVCEAANQRYLEAMANVTLKGEAVRELDGLCRSHTVSGRHVARLSPIGPDDCRLFQAVLHGEHLVRGLRNGDLTALLYPIHRGTTRNSAGAARGLHVPWQSCAATASWPRFRAATATASPRGERASCRPRSGYACTSSPKSCRPPEWEA